MPFFLPNNNHVQTIIQALTCWGQQQGCWRQTKKIDTFDKLSVSCSMVSLDCFCLPWSHWQSLDIPACLACFWHESARSFASFDILLVHVVLLFCPFFFCLVLLLEVTKLQTDGRSQKGLKLSGSESDAAWGLDTSVSARSINLLLSTVHGKLTCKFASPAAIGGCLSSDTLGRMGLHRWVLHRWVCRGDAHWVRIDEWPLSFFMASAIHWEVLTCRHSAAH